MNQTMWQSDWISNQQEGLQEERVVIIAIQKLIFVWFVELMKVLLENISYLMNTENSFLTLWETIKVMMSSWCVLAVIKKATGEK